MRMLWYLVLALLWAGAAGAQVIGPGPASASGCPLAGCTFSGPVVFNSTISTSGGVTLWGAHKSNAGAPTSGGTSGFAVNDTFNVSGGTCTTQPGGVVDTVSGGVITLYHITNTGVCTVPPANPASVTKTSGSGVGTPTLTLTWGPLAADVLFPAFVAGGVNGDTVLGNQAGLGRNVATIGNTIYGDHAGGGGQNTGDGMGGGTGLTTGENTFVGQWAGTQATTAVNLTYLGMNVGGHEVAGRNELLMGADTGKWLYNGNHVVIAGGFNTGTYLQNPQFDTIIGGNSAPGNLVAATVTGAASGAGGVVQLTVNSTAGMLTGDTAVVTNVGGTTEANGYWTAVTINDGTHITLTGGPAFVHAWTSGGGVNDFTSVRLINTTAVGYNNLAGATMRSAGALTLIGNNMLNNCTTCTRITAAGGSAGAAVTSDAQHVLIGDGAGATLAGSNGVTLVGYNADSTIASIGDAVGIGGAGNGGGQGAVASNQGTTVGARSGSKTMGGNMDIFGYRNGNSCGGSNGNILLVGTGFNADCAGSSSHTNAMVFSAEGSLATLASHSINFDGIWNVTGAGTPSTSVSMMAGAFQVGSVTALTLTGGEMGMSKIAASGTAPGAAGAKLALICGTNSGTAALALSAGTSGTQTKIIDNIGAGVTGC